MIYSITSFFIFLLGICIGSFLNVVIFRLEKGESIAKGRSHCPHCRHGLIWLDLIPVFSFIFLQGKCRYCGKKISAQYPMVEMATGIMFLLIFNYQLSLTNQVHVFDFWSIATLVFLAYVWCSMIVIFVYDLRFYLIPDNILFPAIIVSFIWRLIHFSSLGNYVLAACIASGFFLFIYIVSKGKWMGFGDVKLAILLGLILGLPAILLGLFLSFFFGAIIGLVLMYFQKKGLKSEVPFAPFLIAGTFVAMFWGEKIIDWYLHFLMF